MSIVGKQMKEAVKEYEMKFSFDEAFPIGLPVKDCEGRPGIVVGYDGAKVLVQETGMPVSERPPPVPLAPESIAPMFSRPHRQAMLASVEQCLMVALASRDWDAAHKLASTRALLLGSP